MSNRYANQFIKNFEQQPFLLAGSFIQSGSTGAFATRVTQGLTLTAVKMGSAGNSITIAFTGGGTAGAEVVSVSNKAISVQIQSGVSTVTQVRTALNAAAPAAALVTTTGTSGSAVSSASALALTGGADTVFTKVSKGFLIEQIGTGVFQIDLEDSYNALLSCDIMILSSSAADLIPQLQSVDVSAASKAIIFRTQAAASPTNLSSGQGVYIKMMLRNSSK